VTATPRPVLLTALCLTGATGLLAAPRVASALSIPQSLFSRQPRTAALFVTSTRRHRTATKGHAPFTARCLPLLHGLAAARPAAVVLSRAPARSPPTLSTEATFAQLSLKPRAATTTPARLIARLVLSLHGAPAPRPAALAPRAVVVQSSPVLPSVARDALGSPRHSRATCRAAPSTALSLLSASGPPAQGPAVPGISHAPAASVSRPHTAVSSVRPSARPRLATPTTALRTVS